MAAIDPGVPTLDPLIEEAHRRGYLHISSSLRITYHARRDYEDDFRDPEETVRAYTYSWLIIERNYSPRRMNLEVTVPRRVPNDWADIVVYEDDACRIPYLVVENKEPRASAHEHKQAIEQGFGNANSLRAKYVLVDWGGGSAFYDVAGFPQDERMANKLGSRAAVPSNYGQVSPFALVAGGADDIKAVPPQELETKVRRAHALIWAGGKRDPLKSFDEWSKLLFAKIYDERRTPNGQPRGFQIGAKETATQVANRVRGLYANARSSDPSVFTDPNIDLPDEKIREVVEAIQDIGLTRMSVDGLGHAFEQFFGSIFRGGLGQYFTRRELARFMVAMVRLTDADVVIDPTAGSGGFLLEALLQVWHYIDRNYAGQPDAERMRLDFAHKQLFGIEINDILGRVCQTNLLLHKDGHTNVETDRTCLDSKFANPRLRADGTVFTVALGNPPFGDKVKADDRDALGSNSLAGFDLGKGNKQVQSETVIVERAFQFLRPGGRLAMVVPDGLLNNPGEGSRCPAFRRFLLHTAKINAIISLPDHAFRKSGAQNKTSILFATKYTDAERRVFAMTYDSALAQRQAAPLPAPEGLAAVEAELGQDEETEVKVSAAELSRAALEVAALSDTLPQLDYHVFLAEAEEIGYSPSGTTIRANDLYSLVDDLPDYADPATILGQYERFRTDPEGYALHARPLCSSIAVSALFDSHPTYRMDPKYHLFAHERLSTPPAGMRLARLGDVLKRREEAVRPTDEPDHLFLVPTLSQQGELSEREAGGNNPPSWYGEYFTSGSRWFRIHEDDLIFSQIDLWKGCVTVVPEEFAGAIVTKEFPIYEVDRTQLEPYYLKLVLRSQYFQRAIRAITTGHSNRRRTQSGDFEDLTIFLPVEMETQQRVSEAVGKRQREIALRRRDYADLLKVVDRLIVGEISPDDLLAGGVAPVAPG